MIISKILDNFLFTKLGIAIFLSVVLLAIGISGYYFYFDYTLVDAVYMTIITVATVGFGEVQPLTIDGKLFTAALIVLSILIFTFSVTTISAYLVSEHSLHHFKRKKMLHTIHNLKGHTVVCGYGRNGKQAVSKLELFKQAFVIVESNQNLINTLETENKLYALGNATDDEVLKNAGIEKAKYLITTLPSDADNVFIALSARQLNKNIVIISRATEEASIKKLKIAGVDNVIMPDRIGGDHMASLIVSPDLLEFIDNLSLTAEKATNIQEIYLDNFANLSNLQAMQIKQKTGCTVIGYKSKSKEYIINPDPELILEPEGRIIVLGRSEQIEKLNQIFKLKP